MKGGSPDGNVFLAARRKCFTTGLYFAILWDGIDVKDPQSRVCGWFSALPLRTHPAEAAKLFFNSP